MKRVQFAFEKYISHYGWKSVFVVYLKQLTALIIVPILILETILFYVYLSDLKESVNTNISIDSMKFQKMINSELNNMEEVVTQLESNKSFNFFRYRDNIFFNETKDSEEARSLSKELSLNMRLSESVASIDIYFKQNGYVFSTNNAGYLESFERKNIVNNFLDGVNIRSHYGVAVADDVDTVTVYFAEYVHKKLNYVVFLTVDITDVIREELSLKKQVFTMALPDGEIIYCSDQRFLKNKSEYKITEIEDISIMDTSFEYGTYDAELDFLNIKFKVYLKIDEYNESKRNIVIISVLCFCVSFLLVVLISAYMSNKYYKKLMDIFEKFNGIDVGTEKYRDEFELIESNISLILATNNVLQEDIVAKVAKLKKLQFAVMQNQINPHIILNTINSVKLYLYNLFGDDDIPIVLMDGMSYMLSALLDTENIYIKISDEIEYTKQYLKMESIKQMDSFDVIWDVDESILDCMTIKLILQPIVENALFHGIYPLRDRKGILEIKIYKENTDIVFVVKDNGCGISDDKLKQIRDSFLDDNLPSGRHIGLKNILVRLKGFYEDDSLMTITSNKNGTSVKIEFPI